ncbi:MULTISPECIES: hypothetical protein [Streptomyces]|uniref:Uncharacterized protein n=1 Tax=Streptomyces odorifer TaxID=53450 RepID=A0A7Y6KJV0_9ACTN|nr:MULTISPECIES: hypothetical protein [Streptomyces albidoflavus group]NUV32421.1 hypothetical protein [Streptomyces odorifer]NUV37663.1 hypothetical protein [Streptomyces sp. KAI-27]NUV50351.1 hypothetical protein [Streptomyces sp. CAI-78]
MARPTPAQYATGTATVVLATLALLLLTGTTGGAGVALIAAAALGLGLGAACTVPRARPVAPAGTRGEAVRRHAGVALPGGERGLRG